MESDIQEWVSRNFKSYYSQILYVLTAKVTHLDLTLPHLRLILHDCNSGRKSLNKVTNGTVTRTQLFVALHTPKGWIMLSSLLTTLMSFLILTLQLMNI
ncbi:hypothetical protein ACHQM5_008140 [Ranunculus cassubicifolius]